MVNAKIATGAEQPINRHGGLAQYAGEEADLVGVDANGDVVKADADSLVLVKARGVMLGPVEDMADYANVDPAVRMTVKANRTLLGEHRISYVQYGIVVENSDEDWDFTAGDDVYLAPGGGFTQTQVAGASGDIDQVVGYAIDDGNSVVLDVSMDSTIA